MTNTAVRGRIQCRLILAVQMIQIAAALKTRRVTQALKKNDRSRLSADSRTHIRGSCKINVSVFRISKN